MSFNHGSKNFSCTAGAGVSATTPTADSENRWKRAARLQQHTLPRAHRRSIETAAKANCRRCFMGENCRAHGFYSDCVADKLEKGVRSLLCVCTQLKYSEHWLVFLT